MVALPCSTAVIPHSPAAAPPKEETLKRTVSAFVFAIAAVSAHAAAPAYPQKPIVAVVPFPAGGSTDMVARVIGPSVNQKLGQPFVIDNRPGATGAIGATIVKNAKPDGYTILVASIGVYAINPFLQKNLQYDPAKDFDLLTVAVRAP